jgi:hypothetical protein
VRSPNIYDSSPKCGVKLSFVVNNPMVGKEHLVDGLVVVDHPGDERVLLSRVVYEFGEEFCLVQCVLSDLLKLLLVKVDFS